ncbi:MAG: hypothetical protein GX933_08815 [Chloroflexi bacterium]|nr:hypothetical protein [Chloroflexota bacterium]
MSPYINPENATTERNRLKKGIVLAIRELQSQSERNDLTRDLIAFILIALEEITQSVDDSVQAWEKRGYWLKADRFRMEWDWARILSERLRPNVLAENYEAIIPDMLAITQALKDLTIAKHHRLGTPWVGCWDKLTRPSAHKLR